MRRRSFMAGLVSLVAAPLASEAQPPAMLVIGYLSQRSPKTVERFWPELGVSLPRRLPPRRNPIRCSR